MVLGVNRKRVQRLMRMMGIEAIYPKRRTTWPAAGHKIYPYLLRNVAITRPDQVWASDITYVPLRHGFLYLVAVMDWYSRYVLSWRLSNTLDGELLLGGAGRSARRGRPEIFNSDQGSQFTAAAFTARLETARRGDQHGWPWPGLDNVFIERLWRSVKYEEVYLKDYADGWEAEASLAAYFRFYNEERIHQSLGYRTPADVYRDRGSSGRPQPDEDQHEIAAHEGDRWLVPQKLRLLQRPRGTFGGPAGRQQHYLIQPCWLSNQWGPPHAAGRISCPPARPR